jgi:segregation and condensation protein A
VKLGNIGEPVCANQPVLALKSDEVWSEAGVMESTDTTAAWPDGEGPVRVEPDADPEALIVDVGGFEGPLDLLLELARQHKIDLAKISILALAEQYLAFMENARKMRLEIAADYLVMAAWLAYLKSRLLLPSQASDEEPQAEDLAARLAFRLQRLQAMRDAAANLMARNLLGRDVFERGAPEPLQIETQNVFADNLFDLLKAYADRTHRKTRHQNYTVARLPTWSIKEAREVIERLLGAMDDWGSFDSWLADYLADDKMRRSVTASSFTASLELAREGRIEIRQDEAFKPIYMRRRVLAA